MGRVVRGVVREGEVGRGGTRGSELLVGGLTCAVAEAGVEERVGTGAGVRGGAVVSSLRVRTDSKTESMADATASSTLAA